MAKGNKKRKNNRHKKNKPNHKAIKPDSVKNVDENTEDDKVEDTPDVQSEDLSRKRQLSDDDSDTETAPKRKKKKKQPVATESTDKKGKKSIRQMKREKYLERQAEAESANKEQLKTQCLSYISQWKHDKANWKFMKAKQVWLTKNKFSSIIPDESWPLLLEYLESTQGNGRKILLEDANKVIKQMDEWTEKNGANTDGAEDDDESTKPDETTYKRARDLIQCLQE